MNPALDIIFTITWFTLLIVAIRQMSRGFNAIGNTRPVNEMYTKTVTKPVHPEMTDVKPGEKLMGVSFNQEPQDPLYKSLEDRIQTIRDEEGTTDIEEDDEDDGGDVVVTRR